MEDELLGQDAGKHPKTMATSHDIINYCSLLPLSYTLIQFSIILQSFLTFFFSLIIVELEHSDSVINNKMPSQDKTWLIHHKL